MELSVSFFIKAIYMFIIARLAFKAIRWVFTYLNQMRVMNKIKGLPMLPIIGNIHQLGQKEEFLCKMTEMATKFKDEPIFRFWRGWLPVIVFHKGEHLDILMSGSKNTEKSFEYDFLHPWLGTGLLTSHGEKWSARRRLITPTFHFEILNDFLPIMNEQADILIEILTKISKSEADVDIFEKIGLCALDVICETAMGQNVNAQHDANSKYVRTVKQISSLIRARAFDLLQWYDFSYSFTKPGKEHQEYLQILHEFTQKVIQQRHAEFETSNLATQKRIAFLDMLLKAKSEDETITFSDIQEEVDTFMFEGHDTTAAAASWACQLIGSHPDVQKKLHEEIDEIFGCTNRNITNDDLNKLKYLECVIKETLRLFPSVPFFGRIISEDTTIAGHRILEGTSAIIFSYMVHRDEKYYPEPEKFDPERFLPENTKNRHPYAYIPFSAGRRNCIGQRFALMEEKVLLANILRKFEIKSKNTIQELQPTGDLILKPLVGIPVKLTLRNMKA